VNSRDTLQTLVSVSRSRPSERELCCPNCGGGIELWDALLCCQVCLRDFATLAELAVREVPRG
jgi:predicted amidophosphoribosyltransferase